MVEKAAAFAMKAHEGAYRKGTKVPYIVHPLETAVIVSLISPKEELICAALLHDVVEDAGVTRQELLELFGPYVTELVMSETEDKSKTWKERKSAALKHLETASLDSKILVLADKLSNIRCTARDYLIMGDKVWERFNEKRKDEQGWYYLGVKRRLEGLLDYPAYKEYAGLCTKVFGKD